MADYNRNRGYNDRGRDLNESRTGYGNRYEETSYRSGYGTFGNYGDRDEDRPYRSDRGESNWRGSNENRDNYGGRDHDRGFFERAGDEVRSWFGDDEAERRRRMDERNDERHDRYDYDRGSDYRHNYGTGGWDSNHVRRDLDDDTWRRSARSNYGYDRRNQESGYTSGLGSDYGRGEHYPSTTGYGGPGYGGLNERSNYGSDRGDNDHSWRGGSGRWDMSHDTGRDRGPIERAGDEVRTWFGDDEAERRRRMDGAGGNWNDRRDQNRGNRDDDRRNSRSRW